MTLSHLMDEEEEDWSGDSKYFFVSWIHSATKWSEIESVVSFSKVKSFTRCNSTLIESFNNWPRAWEPEQFFSWRISVAFRSWFLAFSLGFDSLFTSYCTSFSHFYMSSPFFVLHLIFTVHWQVKYLSMATIKCLSLKHSWSCKREQKTSFQ